MTLLSTIATIFGIVSALGLIPQVIKIYKNKSAQDISILSYSFFFIGTIIWFLYGLELKNIAILLGNALGGIFNLTVIIGCLLYGNVKR